MSETRPESSTPTAGRSAPSGAGAWIEERRIVGRNATKADVLLGRIGDRPVAIKDYGPRPALVRVVLGRWLTAREVRAYVAAGDLEGLPACLGRRGPTALVLERVPGRPLAELAVGDVRTATFDRLDGVLAALHARGVALGDVHHRDVLVTADGDVRVVDLATAWVRGRAPWSRWIFRRFRDQDRVAAARLRARYLGGDEGRAIESVGRSAAAWHRRGRTWKRWVDRLRGRRSDR